jgi:hypothetical protein
MQACDGRMMRAVPSRATRFGGGTLTAQAGGTIMPITSSSRRGRRVVRALVRALLVLGLAPAGLVQAGVTHYVRTDGGDAAQCTGRSDAAYPGSGTAQACAWKHPFLALPPGGPARIAGGDTLVIDSGSYMMGLGAPGAVLCNQSWSWDCHMVALPSGPSAAEPTRIVGRGTPAPELWGTERASMVLNLQGSSNVEISNVEVTDHESCIDHHCHGGVCSGEVIKCNRTAAPWGKWAGTGLSARDSRNVRLTDVNIHGMANRGVFAGRLTDWTMERLKIRGNGWSGWDGDIPDDDTNAGTIHFRELELSWNGCGERWPSGEPWGCWAQTAGGYGDGLGTGATAGHWVIEDSNIHHNTSDGLDLLYMKEGGRVTIRRTWAEGNAGNQLKTKGEVLIENSVVVGNCAYFTGWANMFAGDHCRALGNTVSVGLHAASTATLRHNTITGQGDCLLLSGGGGTGARLELVGNVLLGQVDWRQDWEQTCGHYSDGGLEAVSWSRNLVYAVKNGNCPAGSLCVAPLLAAVTLGGFDPTPLAGSPLVDAAAVATAPLDDLRRNLRPTGAGPDLGAIELGGSPAPTPDPEPTPEPPPPSPEPTPAPVPTLQVQSVSVVRTVKGAWHQYAAQVRIVDAAGTPVPNALVSGQWTNAGASSGSAGTDANGLARIDGGRSKRALAARFCVTAVSASGYAAGAIAVCATSN